MRKKLNKRIYLIFLFAVIIFGGYLFNSDQRNNQTSLYANIKEVNTFPEEIVRMLENPLGNPLRQTLPPVQTYSHFKIPILLYHYVEYVQDPGDKIRISLNVTPYTFEAQLKTLKDNGFTFITTSDIPKYFNGTEKVPDKPIILTFDDGYKDFYTDVFPLLKKYQAKAVAYIITGFLDEHNNLSKAELKEISDSGLVEIGAHTVHHLYLKGMDQKKAEFEIEQSKTDLEKDLRIKIVSFAYPYGAFDLKTAQLVKKLGFQTAVSTVSGTDVNLDNLYFLYRIRPGYRTGESLLKIL